MARETRLWQWMKTNGHPYRDLDMRRVENLVGLGTPDVEGCKAGAQFWVELKGCNRPARPTSKLIYELTKPQSLWLRKRWRCGGSSWLYFRVGIGRNVKRYLIPGCSAKAVEHCVPESELARLTVLPEDHSFAAFLDLVTRRRLF